MKQLRILKSFVFTALLSILIPLASSCNDDEGSTTVDFGTVSGMVTDESGAPISNVAVTISNQEGSVTTGSDGKYTFPNVSIESHAVIFTKKGYLTLSATVVAEKFNENKVASIDVSMIFADAKITGTILDGKNDDRPLAGVTVSVGNTSVISGNDGKYLIEDLAIEDYNVIFSKDNYATVVKNVSKSDFLDGVVTIDLRMGGTELLRGMTADDLAEADKWYYSEYRGGGNADAYPHWDWACDYMSSLSFWGNWEEQWEGTTLRIRNDEDQRENPADLDVFDSYIYGSKYITADNKILSLRIRTHNADDAAPAHFGVQVIDLSAANPTAVKVDENKTYGSGDYSDFHFDLSNYIGKEIVIAIGIYRAESGDYWKQLVLRRIAFAQENVVNWDWIPGTEIEGLEGWQLTQEMVRSTMPHLKNSFTGISPISAGRDVNMESGYPAAYRAWRDVAHIAHEWSFVPLKKDPETFAGEGFLIKTRNTSEVNTQVPEAYIYAKFAIAQGSNTLTLKGRNFQSGSAPDHLTYFKLTAIEENGKVTHVEPSSHVADLASPDNDGCWKFRHYAGSKADPDSYARFVYDLSQFNGRNVVLVFGVYNGAANTSENKLAFYTVDLN